MDPRPAPPPHGQEDTAYRHMPYDIEVEQALLGAMLGDPRYIDMAAAEITAEDFYDPLHGRIFDAAIYMATEGDVNPLVLHAVMKADPGVIEIGGMAYFVALRAAAPALPNIRDFANILKDLASKRRLITIGEDIVNSAYDGPLEQTSRAIANRASDALLEIGISSHKPRRSVYQIAMDSAARMEKAMQGEPIPMVKTGWEKVDDELGGLRGGDLIILLGKSGMGKSALFASLARNTSNDAVPTLVFSLEMTEDQLVERMVCDEEFGGSKPLWYSKVRNATLDDDEFGRYMVAGQQFEGRHIEIIDDAEVSMQEISARARAFKAKHKGKLGIVLIDYLQIVVPANERDPREQQVRGIAHAMKVLAKTLDWPVVALSQANEGDVQRSKENSRPHPSDTRESKGIQHEADLMLSPYRPAYWVAKRKPLDLPPGSPEWNKWSSDMRQTRHRFELLTLKNRHGREKDFELWCEMAANAIRDREPDRRLSIAEEQERDSLEGLLP